jgi:hypothetical protein
VPCDDSVDRLGDLRLVGDIDRNRLGGNADFADLLRGRPGLFMKRRFFERNGKKGANYLQNLRFANHHKECDRRE